jgi:hypothetical protein
MSYRYKFYQALSSRKHYDSHKSIMKKRARKCTTELIARNLEILRRHLASHPCIDCGESDLVVLDFDHVRGSKVREVSEMARRGVCVKKLKHEIEKCDIRCANCHRRVTAKRRQENRFLEPPKPEVVDGFLF